MPPFRMPDAQPITDADLADLVQRMDEAAKAFIKGDIDHYQSLFDHADHNTLMSPTGGPTVRGFDPSSSTIAPPGQYGWGGVAWCTSSGS